MPTPPLVVYSFNRTRSCAPITSNFPTPCLSSGASHRRHLLLCRCGSSDGYPCLSLRCSYVGSGTFMGASPVHGTQAATSRRMNADCSTIPVVRRLGCLLYASSVSSGFQWGHLDTSAGASLRSLSVDPGSTLPIPTPHLKSAILTSYLNLSQAARQCGPGRV